MGKVFDVISIIFFILAIVLVASIYFEIKSEGFKCINDPLIYGAELLDKLNNDKVLCSCTLSKPYSPTLYFTSLNKSIFTPLNDNYASINADFQNFTFDLRKYQT